MTTGRRIATRLRMYLKRRWANFRSLKREDEIALSRRIEVNPGSASSAARVRGSADLPRRPCCNVVDTAVSGRSTLATKLPFDRRTCQCRYRKPENEHKYPLHSGSMPHN